MRIARTIAFVCLFLGAGVLQARAFDMTGTWEGKWTCRVQRNGTPTTIANDDSIMKITQVGSNVHVDLDNGAYLYNGWAVADNDNARRGATTVVECRTNPSSPVYNETISAKVKTSSGGGEFNGTSAFNSTDVSPLPGCSPLDPSGCPDVSAVRGCTPWDPRCASALDSTEDVIGDIGGICRYAFKRISSTDPGVGPCPPQ